MILEAYDQFGRVDLTESSYYGQGYDYHSIMSVYFCHKNKFIRFQAL